MVAGRRAMKKKQNNGEQGKGGKLPSTIRWQNLTIEQAQNIVRKWSAQEKNLVGVYAIQLEHAKKRIEMGKRRQSRGK